MYVIKPGDADNAEMAKQADGRRLALLCKSLPSVSSLVGLFVGWLVGSFHSSRNSSLFQIELISKEDVPT